VLAAGLSGFREFRRSDEKVFKVFHRQAQQREARIPLADIGRPA